MSQSKCITEPELTLPEIPEGAYLSDISVKDKPWDLHRAQADAVQAIYAQVREFEHLAERMSVCSGYLRFAWEKDFVTGKFGLRLREAHFCRVRYCPLCQWRRALMWLARFYQALPKLESEYPKARWILLTLTVRNCPIEQLRQTLKSMNQAWQRLKARKEFRSIQGWVRTTEVTYNQQTHYAHPHFHTLLMVKPSYFDGLHYISQTRWIDLWREALRVDYKPSVDIRTVKPRGGNPGDILHAGVKEVLKYGIKPADMVENPDWFLELTCQTYKLRFVAAGGVLKDVLKVDEESDEDLALLDEGDGNVDEDKLVTFGWHKPVKRYRKTT